MGASEDIHRSLPDITWESRLPRRLERAGNFTLLEIDLRNVLDIISPCNNRMIGFRTCFCVDAARRTTKELLVTLAGPHGELCHRWKSLYLDLGHNFSLGEEMAYPTPNLEAVWLQNPFSAPGVSILPSLPKLKTLEIFSPLRFTLPKVENVRNLAILHLSDRSMDFSNLKTATNIETLTIETTEPFIITPIPYSLPQFLPHLSSISFIRGHFLFGLKEVEAPNIRRISLKLANNRTLQTFVDSSLPFWDLQELELTWPNVDLAVYEELRTTTRELLLSCINLTRIEGDRRTLSVIVKLYWEECATRSAGREHIMGETLTFWSNDVRRGISVRVPEGKLELEGLASSLRLIPPSMSWEDMRGVLFV